MKRFMMRNFLALALALACAFAACSALADGGARDADLPAGVARWLTASRYADWDATGWVRPNGQEDGFALVTRDGANTLLWFRVSGGSWSYVRAITKAVPQGGLPVELWDASGAALIDETPLDTAFVMGCNNGEYYERALTFQKVDRTWRLVFYAPNGQSEMTRVREDSITYFVCEDFEQKVRGTVQTDLRWFSLNALPKTVAEAREKLSNPPRIPSGDLSAKRVKFTGGRKYAVYAGPGADYLRPANGKASVSTNDWIQVFGEENGWILVQYDIGGGRMRVGWIEEAALPKGASADALAFAPTAAVLSANVSLTDDPLGERDPLGRLDSGTAVLDLARMGDWAYIETEIAGQPARGFVPAKSVAAVALVETDVGASEDVG